MPPAAHKARRSSVMGSTDSSSAVAGSSKSYTSQQSSHKFAASGEIDATDSRTKPSGLPPVPTAIKAHRRSVN